MTYQHRIRRPYHCIPLTDRLRPTVVPPAEWGTRLMFAVCVVAVIVVAVAV